MKACARNHWAKSGSRKPREELPGPEPGRRGRERKRGERQGAAVTMVAWELGQQMGVENLGSWEDRREAGDWSVAHGTSRETWLCLSAALRRWYSSRFSPLARKMIKEV